MLEFETLALLVLQIDLLCLYAIESLDSLSAPSGRLLMQPELLSGRPDETKNGVGNIGCFICGLTVTVERKRSVSMRT